MQVQELTELVLKNSKGRGRLAAPLEFFQLLLSYLLEWVVPFSSSTAWAAARRAVSRRKGEQET